MVSNWQAPIIRSELQSSHLNSYLGNVMPESLTSYRVFIASPGGLEKERLAFNDLIETFNKTDAIPRGAYFIPVGWEVTLGGVGRPQSLINEEVESCDYFVMVLHSRWGSSPDPEDNPGSHSSGTKEEYEVALKCHRAGDKPMRQIVAFFKAVDTAQMADPGPDLLKVLEFRKQLENTKNCSLRRTTFQIISKSVCDAIWPNGFGTTIKTITLRPTDQLVAHLNP